MKPHKLQARHGRLRAVVAQPLANDDALPEPVQPTPTLERYLNCAKGFWETYRMRIGSPRRQALLALFRAHPMARLPVNNRWQANTVDADLQMLLKRGVLRQVREGGGRRHPMNKSSSKRQSYLVLA